MSAPPITADAAGISDAGKKRTGSVVDQLLAPDIAATAESVVYIDTARVWPHPLNRKVEDDDVADIVAGLKAGGRIINPLGVTAAADWNAGRPADLKDIPAGEFIITAGGHRRLKAAELAGLKTVPCLIRADGATQAGRRDALLENLHRKNLDPFQEAEAFAELNRPPYGLSQHDLAAMINCNQSHISKRIKLLKLPSQVRAMYTSGQLKIDDCLELTRLVAVDGLLDKALSTLRAKSWFGSVERLVDKILVDAEAAKARQVEVDRLTAAGVPLLDRAPSYYTGRGNEPVQIDSLGITAAAHKKEPCRAAYVVVDHDHAGKVRARTVYCCTEPKRHVGAQPASPVKATSASTSSTAAAAAASMMSTDERARRKRVQELKKTVAPARRAVVAQLLQAGGFDAETRRDIVVQSVLFRVNLNSFSDCETVIDLLGIRPKNPGAYLDDVFAAFTKKHRDQAALGAALGYFESRLRDPGPYSRWDDEDRWYLDLLERHSYVITDTEHEQLGDVRDDTGEWVRAKENPPAAQCRVCFAYLHDLPAGVTKVADDLCSACSDAAGAGWVAQDQPVAIADTHADGAPKMYECPACEGGGTVLGGHEEDTPAPCERCNGDGVVEADELQAVSA